MGLFSAIVAYKIGKRAGRKKAERRAALDDDFGGDPECLNFDSFCSNYGSCDGMVCEYDEQTH